MHRAFGQPGVLLCLVDLFSSSQFDSVFFFFQKRLKVALLLQSTEKMILIRKKTSMTSLPT